MAITINGSGTITGITAGGLPDDCLTAAEMPAGSVLQVVSTQKIDAFTTTSNSYVDIAGLNVSITPTAASSKIFIIATIQLSTNTGSNEYGGWYLRFLRDANSLPVGTFGNANQYSAAGGLRWQVSNTMTTEAYTYLDSPNTTASINYKPQVAATTYDSGRIVYVNRDNSNNSNFSGTGVSTITLMEIAA